MFMGGMSHRNVTPVSSDKREFLILRAAMSKKQQFNAFLKAVYCKQPEMISEIEREIHVLDFRCTPESGQWDIKHASNVNS